MADAATFEDLGLDNALRNAIEDLGFERPTEVQLRAFPLIRSGRTVVGISQTGTGKTAAYVLPILRDMKYSKQVHPRAVILVPTRELVVQVVDQIGQLSAYMDRRIVGVYGGTNMNTQAQYVAQGVDILVATPGRIYDLIVSGLLKVKTVKQLVIDEVDVMLDLGFRPQLNNIFDLLPERRQNIMFSATMTEEVEELIAEYFIEPDHIAVAVSGTPLDHIEQQALAVPNFYTKINLLRHLLKDRERFAKVLIFTQSKKEADMVFDLLSENFGSRLAIIHSNRSQNARLRAVEEFDSGERSILIATDVIARGLDLDKVSHVINFDTPTYPENYMHRIGRTGRAERHGVSILLYTEREEADKEAIEGLMDMEIPEVELPEEVEIAQQKLPSEKDDQGINKHIHRNQRTVERGEAFHDRSEKNQQVNQGNSWRRKVAEKYKKPKTKGDKVANRLKKGKKR